MHDFIIFPFHQYMLTWGISTENIVFSGMDPAGCPCHKADIFNKLSFIIGLFEACHWEYNVKWILHADILMYDVISARASQCIYLYLKYCIIYSFIHWKLLIFFNIKKIDTTRKDQKALAKLLLYTWKCFVSAHCPVVYTPADQ